MSKLSKETRVDLALQLASMLYEQLPARKRRSTARWFKYNNADTKDVWQDCLKQAAKMIDQADFKLLKYLED